ncbi:hypothetical protein QVD17_18202 [Tagetes erecta]|uniref:Uncharacterized protein n=1 Tax=Tagetes erecta TaxID=13708 RepID=A0AAD8NVL1_TARER|nr:hypothetical protein QVD17_18202 [Tagetes erecta]
MIMVCVSFWMGNPTLSTLDRSQVKKLTQIWKMDAAVSSIVTQVVQSLMVPLKKHFGFFISSTKNVKDMEEKMDQLNLTEKGIRDKWEDAVERNHEVPHNVLPWLDNVKKMNEKAQNIPKGRIGCFNMAKRYRVGKECFNVLEEIQALETRGSKIVFTNAQRPLADIASTSTPGGSTQNNIKSRDKVYNDALESLRSNNESQKMIALCGMGGVGKTTMMEQLKKDVEGSKSFDRVVKVVLGETTNPIAIQRAIAIYLDGKDLIEEDKDARAERLCKRFEEMSKQGKKTLVIMDDLWTTFELKDVGLSPLPNGFKLLFTSRDERNCTSMGVKINSIFKVGLLNSIEAKHLFFGNVELSDGDDVTLQQIGEDIVKKCQGLPIAILTIAKSLTNNIVEAWEKALRRLEQDDLKDIEIITYRIFEMSYENLKEDSDKAIFLLSALFPDDFDIRTEDLFRYGWGLGFFKDTKTLVKSRGDMKTCVNNLICANLLIESDHIGCVKMHDLVRAFVLDKISEVKQASICDHDKYPLTKEVKTSYERILLKCTGMEAFPVDFNHSNLSLLLLIDGSNLLKFPDDIYKRLESLQVVSYENMHIPSHLLTFEHSTKLRTLCLRSCQFIMDDISLLGSLSNLETLSFVDCNITRLPLAIGKLKRLKLLDLTRCVRLHIDDGVFQNLSSLEELYMRATKDKPIRFTKANFDELQVLSDRLFALELEFFESKDKLKNMSIKKLKRFRISIGCQIELEHDEVYTFRNTIRFVGDRSELLECKISDLFDKTETLYLEVNDMRYINEDVSVHYAFSSLRVLGVHNCKDLTYLFTVDVASALNKLERLSVSECRVMRTLVAENGGEEVIRFRKLTFMSLTNLPEMVSFWDNVIELPEMMELVVDGLPKFTSIYHNTYEMQALLNKKVVIPKLREIIVRKCDNLINLFPCNTLPSLSNLEEVEVNDCGSVEVLFIVNFESVCGKEGSISRLRSIKAEKLEKLKELWRVEGVNNSNIPITCFKGVELIRIEDCKMFKNVFTPTTVNFDLGGVTGYITINIGKERDTHDIVKGEISEVDIPSATYPSSLLHMCHHLEYLELNGDERVEEVVFEMDTHQQPLLLPYLQDLELFNLKEMSHVWKCSNWNNNNNNKFLHQPAAFQSPFQNLTDIYLYSCHKIKYLFSPLMAKYLSNLKQVWIEECGGIEEVISRRDDENENEENTSSSHYQTTLLFPHLDTLQLFDLSSLKSIDDESQNNQVIGACWSLCQYPTNIDISSCDALSVLIPWYAAGKMNRLQELTILNCTMMVEVFESELRSSNVDEGISGTTLLTVPTITTLKVNQVVIKVPQLFNLKDVCIENCDLLSHVFTFSTLETLKQLKQLSIQRCKAIKVIVKQENEKSSKDQVVFPHLEILQLEDLPHLKGFFLGMNEFRWPLLDDVRIDNCPQLKMFTHGQSKTPKLKYISTKLGKHSIECGLNFHEMINEHQTLFPASSDDPTVSKRTLCSFHNLVEIDIDELINVGNTNIIPSNGLLHLVKLEKIYSRLQMAGILSWDRDSSVEEVFEVGAALDENESQQAVVKIPIPNLTEMSLYNVISLKYLWKSNQWKVLEFPNLTTLSINECDKLEHVFTCSMVDSLMQLQDLHISQCKNIEVIVKEGDENESDGKVNEITQLPRLKSLKLNNLARLKGFCIGKNAFSFPALNSLEIKNCPSLATFTKEHVSTPELKVIDTSFGMYYVKPDLNSFIKTKQESGFIAL